MAEVTTEMNFVLTEKNDNILTVTMNRPKALNSLHPVLMHQIIDALDEAEKDDDVKVIVLTGAGKGFCAGGDIQYMDELENNVMLGRQYIVDGVKVSEKIMTLKKPVVAMVNGVAAGAGFNLALACDIIFCDKRARFAQSFAKVGLIPDAGGTYLLPRVVGLAKAKEIMFTADLIDSEEALKLGIVNHAYDTEELAEKTYEYAKRLAEMPPISLDFIKKAVNASLENGLTEMLELEVNLQTICLQTEDNKEGLAAFKEKRQAKFTGK